MNTNLLASLLVATSLTACGGSGGGAGGDVTLAAIQTLQNELPENGDGEFDLTTAVRIPKAEFGATASFDGIAALASGASGQVATVGTFQMDVNFGTNTVTGSATNFNDYTSNGSFEVFDVADLTKVESYAGTLTISNGVMTGNQFANVSGSLDGTLVAGSTGTNYVVDGAITNGGFARASNGAVAFLGLVEGTITSPDGVTSFANDDAGVIIATQ